MKNAFLFFSVISVFILQSCAADIENLRKLEKFSLQKKYAVIPFNCQDKFVGEELSEALRNWLVKYGYNIIDSASVHRLFGKNKLTVPEVVKDYSKVLGKIDDIDGLIIGFIYFDKKSAKTGNIMANTNSSGGYRSFIEKCDVLVIELNSGDILASANYTGDINASLGAYSDVEEIGRKLSLKLSPH